MAAPVYRLLELDTCLGAGNLFPRWLPDLYGGRGGLFFHFYAPLSYYVAEFFHFVGIGYIGSIKATYLISFILSGMFMYFFVKEKTDHNGAIIAAILYMYSPYRFIDVYVRGDLAEAFAFVFFPIILLFLERLIKNRTIENILLLSFSYAGLILTHNIIAVIFTYFLLLYSAYLAYQKILPTKEVIISVLLAFSLSAFFWIPAILEKGYVHIEKTFFQLSFVELRQILPDLSAFFEKNREISYQIGAIHLVFSIAAFALLKDRYTRFIFTILILAVFMMTPYSSYFWKFLPFLKFAQFPWRMLSIIALSTSLLGGLVLQKLPLNNARLILLCLLIVFASYNFIGYSERVGISESDINREELRNLNSGLTYGSEYLPLTATVYDSPVKEKVEIVSGTASINSVEENCQKIGFFAYSPSDAFLRINTYWFPGWTAYLNDKKINVKRDNYGLILLEIPRGHNNVILKFEDTPVRMLANFLSFISIMMLLIIIISQRVTRYLTASRPPP